MSITFIGHTRARVDRIDRFRDFMSAVFVPLTRKAAGCQSCQLFQSETDPTDFVVVEVWNSAEAHRAAVRRLPPGAALEFLAISAAPPNGGYFCAV